MTCGRPPSELSDRPATPKGPPEHSGAPRGSNARQGGGARPPSPQALPSGSLPRCARRCPSAGRAR
eukprot:13289703-Alexandrium_andersonii.AAC.1